MTVRIRLFAALRETVGAGELDAELGAAPTPEEAWTWLAARTPSIASRRGSLAVAVNRRYAKFDAPLAEGDEVCFIPPVSGG